MLEYLSADSPADLTADFEINTNAKLTPILKLREKSKTGIQSYLYTGTPTPIFA